MGQKVNPHGLRVGVIKGWSSTWYADTKNDEFSGVLVEDNKIRKFLKARLKDANVSKIEIERTGKLSANGRIVVTIYTAKPGVIIGKGGALIESLRDDLIKQTSLYEQIKAVNRRKLTDKEKEKAAAAKAEKSGESGEEKKESIKDREIKRIKSRLRIETKAIERPDAEAQLVAENIAQQLEARIGFRRAMKSCMSRAMKSGVLGIKTSVAGRLGGADMARKETYSEGTIPLQTLRANIDYGFAEADTTYGKVGVKTWIYHGEVLPTKGGVEENKISIPQKKPGRSGGRDANRNRN